MLLTTPERCRDFLGLPSTMDDVLPLFTQALHSATTLIAAGLGTDLARASRVDQFYIKRMMGQTDAYMFIDLFLRQGFVVEDSVAIAYGDSFALALSDGVSLLADTYIDLEKGCLRVTSNDIERKYVRVAYDHGFEAETTGLYKNILYKASQVPQWLQDLAMHQAIVLASANRAMQQDEDIEPIVKGSQDFCVTVFGDLTRYKPGALKAVA